MSQAVAVGKLRLTETLLQGDTHGVYPQRDEVEERRGGEERMRGDGERKKRERERERGREGGGSRRMRKPSGWERNGYQVLRSRSVHYYCTAQR